MDILTTITNWQHERNTCSDDDIYSVDARHAMALGLPTLSSLCSALNELQHAQGPISAREIIALLRPVLSVAVGEANERVRIHLGDPSLEAVPGVPIIPYQLLERDSQGGVL